MSNRIEIHDALKRKSKRQNTNKTPATLISSNYVQSAEVNENRVPASKTDSSYRAVVIGLAIRFGNEGGVDSVPGCVMNWLLQSVLEGCPTSTIVFEWLYQRQGSANYDIGP